MSAKHSEQTVANGIHIVHAFEYANTAAREGAAGLTAADVGKVAKQTDSLTWWVLTDHTGPTWKEITDTGGGGAPPPIRSESLTEDTTSGSTPVTKTSIVIPDETGTWEIWGYASVSHSNSTGNPNVWLENTTDATELGTRPRWVMEMEDPANDIMKPVIYRRFSNTAGNGAKTIALRYAVNPTSGTMTISDAYLRAVKE